jgi:hypothetical protein
MSPGTTGRILSLTGEGRFIQIFSNLSVRVHPAPARVGGLKPPGPLRLRRRWGAMIVTRCVDTGITYEKGGTRLEGLMSGPSFRLGTSRHMEQYYRLVRSTTTHCGIWASLDNGAAVRPWGLRRRPKPTAYSA